MGLHEQFDEATHFVENQLNFDHAGGRIDIFHYICYYGLYVVIL